MALPFRSPTAISTGEQLTDRQRLDALIRSELQKLAELIPQYDVFRSYYEGEQKLVFGLELFRSIFGTAFDLFRDNWCATVVDALTDRLEVEGLIVEEGSVDTPLSKDLWSLFRNNDIDEQQEDLHEGFAVEGRAFVIVWPDEDLRARIDFQKAQNVHIRYSDDDWRLPVFAIKRWVTADGEIRLTVYTAKASRGLECCTPLTASSPQP